jgi:hypothetical protein
VPSLDLVLVRLGDGCQYPTDFERALAKRALAAVKSPEKP